MITTRRVLRKSKRVEVYKQNINNADSNFNNRTSIFEMFYIGESGRTWNERKTEHCRDIKNKNPNNSIYMHMAQTNHQVDLNNVCILDLSKKKHERKSLESIYIQKYKELAFNLMKKSNVPRYTYKQIFNALK